MNLIIAALATWQIVEIWHHSSLMAGPRSLVEMWDNKLGELLSCPFCLSPWVALICVSCLEIQEYGFAGQAAGVVIMAFAASRLANLCNDYFRKVNRTPKIRFDDYGEED
tara:strand:+ start:461 stop:790 length:330 start_codon:yes stop_codon:yes gene_type:complete